MTKDKKWTTRLEVEELIYDYAAAIDDDRLEEWPEFFVDECEYKIIPRENFDNDMPACIIYCNNKRMLMDRITALRKANIFEEHYSRHILSGVRIIDETNDVIHAECSYLVLQTRTDGETKIYNAGKMVDEIVRVDGALRFRSKSCIFDTHMINTLMVTPI